MMFSSGVRIPPTITRVPSSSGRAGTRSGRARSRRRRGSRDCSGGHASQRDAPSEEPELTERIDRVLRAARVVLARSFGREEPEGPAPELDETRSRGTSRARPLEHVRDLGRRASPCRARRRARRGRDGPRGRSPGRRERSEAARATTRGGAASPDSGRLPCRRSGDGEAEPRLALRDRRHAGTSAVRGSATTPSDRGGRRCRSPSTGRADCGAALRASQAESRLRPRARRRLRIARPPRVDIRARNP